MSPKLRMKRIAIYASGAGSNADKIAEHFTNHESIEVALIVTNKAEAGVLKVAEKHNIPSVVINKSIMNDEEKMEAILSQFNINFIVLAGFLLLIPKYLTINYQNKIINVHPALLPNYGGKGMYGMNVHNAVITAKEKESGITIHYVNEHFDEGEIIFQAKCQVSESDTPSMLAQKIHTLEHKHFSAVIEKLLT